MDEYHWEKKRPTPPQDYIEYNSKNANCQSGKCPNCDQEKPGTSSGHGGFQNRQIQNLMRALCRLNERYGPDDTHWKPFYELFSIDLNPKEQRYATILKCHPSRYGTGTFSCCGAKIWHDFYDDWKYYYKPTKANNQTLAIWF